ncbi:hypothetical protein GXW82_31320 [Streptacidiphilus sp. 4-A2]|nr:hypothetical protein [Streptacidiphilus sp. 4-A2]
MGLLTLGLVSLPGSAAWAAAGGPADGSAANGPVLGLIQQVDTATGVVVDVPVTDSTAVSSVTVTATQWNNGANTFTFTFTLALGTGTATSGVWQSTAPLNLPLDGYTWSGTAQDADGQTSTSSLLPLGDAYLNYGITPAFHQTVFSPTTMTIADPFLTVTGELTQYNPNSGDTGRPMAGVEVQELGGAAGTGEPASDTTKSDGTFDIVWNPRSTTAPTRRRRRSRCWPTASVCSTSPDRRR